MFNANGIDIMKHTIFWYGKCMVGCWQKSTHSHYSLSDDLCFHVDVWCIYAIIATLFFYAAT